MDPMEILLKQKRDEAAMQAMSSGLRRQKDVSNIAMLSGDRLLGNFGQNLSGDVDTQLKLKMASDERGAQRDMTQGYYDQMGAHQTAVLDETKTHNRAMEEASRLAKTMAARKLPNQSARKQTIDSIEGHNKINGLMAGWKDSYATSGRLSSMVGGGSVANFFGSKGIGSPETQDQARWWNDYDLLYTLGRRNELFGSALTATEEAAWDKANISPNSSPEAIRRGLKTLQEIAMNHLLMQQKNDASYSPEWVNDVYSEVMEPYSLDGPQGETLSGTSFSAPSAPGSGAMDWADRKR